MSLAVWQTGSCYCKMVAIGRWVKLCLWQYGRQVYVIVRWLLKAGRYSCVSGNMADRWMLLLGLFVLMLYVPVNRFGHVGTSPPISWDFYLALR